MRIAEAAPARVIERPSPADPAVVIEAGPAQEACRQIALVVRGQLEARGARSLAVVSAVRDEGKTTTSCNLALALASISPGREVALVDLDLRRPSIAQVMSVETQSGIEDVLTHEASLDEARVEYLQPPLDVYLSMSPQRNAHEILTRQRLGDLFGELERRYSLIIVDTPPTLLVPDSRLILERVSLCLPVARAGISRVRSFRELLETLPRSQVLSTVLNGMKPNPQYYQGYDYGDDESEAKRARKRKRHGRT
jgi:Mrp family chromosome partitioning ATPase